MTIGEIGTVYACIVATTSLVWNIVRGSQDTRRASLSAEIQVTAPAGATTRILLSLVNSTIPKLSEGEKSFKITCTNIGRRPLTLEHWELVSPSKSSATGIVPLRTIEESESYSFEITDFNTLRGNVIGIRIFDTHGKSWELPQGQFKMMKELMLEYRL